MHTDGAPQLTFPNIYTPALGGTVEAICKYGGTTYKLLGRVAGYSGLRNLHHSLHPQEKGKLFICCIIINVVSTADLMNMAAVLLRETRSTRVNLDKKDRQTIF